MDGCRRYKLKAESSRLKAEKLTAERRDRGGKVEDNWPQTHPSTIVPTYGAGTDTRGQISLELIGG